MARVATAEIRSTPRPAESGARGAESGGKKSFVQRMAEGARNLKPRDLLVRLRTLGENNRPSENAHVLTELNDKAAMATISGARQRWEPRLSQAPGALPGENMPRMVRDQETINNDFAAVLAQKNGPRAALENALRSAVDENGRRILTDSEVSQKMADEAWVRANSIKTVEKLVRAKMAFGEITEAEVKVIANSRWGADLAASMAEQAQDNAQVQELVNQIKENTKETLLQFLQKEINKKTLLALLLALLGASVKAMVSGSGIDEASRPRG